MTKAEKMSEAGEKGIEERERDRDGERERERVAWWKFTLKTCDGSLHDVV